MQLFVCAIVFVVNSLEAFGGGNQCFKQSVLPEMIKNWKSRHSPFRSVTSLGPIDCARQCKLHTLCSIVNFNTETLYCSLISEPDGVDGIANPASVMINVKSWNENILHTCKNHLCPNNTVCEESRAGFECKPIGCTGLPQDPNINVTSFTSRVLWEFDEVVEYACYRGYFTATNVTCTSNGFWSIVQCTRYVSCGDTALCSEKQSKEVWLYYSSSNSLQKVFCGYENTFSLFISLPEYNTASTPIYNRAGNSCELVEAISPKSFSMGYTDFQKIKKDRQNKKITQSRMYSNSTFIFQQYGRAGDCYTGNDSDVCGVIGHFIINLRGTGFKVKSSVQWTTWGIDGFIQNITRSDDGQVIEGFCGGNCGGCEPSSDLYIEVNSNDTPAFDSAELPICKFPIN